MTKRSIYMVLVSVLSLCLTTACSNDDEELKEPIKVTFSSLTADGSATATTSMLTLTFDKTIEGLEATDITLTAGTTGATKGALTSKGNGVYELAVSGITAAGEVTLAVAKEEHTFTPASKAVAVHYVVPDIAVAFSNLTANGSADETTTALTLTFDKDIDGLKAEDITLTGGGTKAALTAKGSGVYELAITDITATGEVTVAVAKNGYAIAPTSKAVKVFRLSVIITNKPLIAAIEAETYKTFEKNADGDVDVLATANKTIIKGITDLGLAGKNLESLAGIEYFTSLTNLRCNDNKLTTLDVSKLVNVTILTCSENKLVNLDLSALAKLKILTCYNNKTLATLILPSATTALQDLTLHNCALSALDVHAYTNLKSLYCFNNRLSALDVSATKLKLNGYLSVGEQTSDGTTKQDITVTVTQAQKDGMKSDWLTDSGYVNTNVILNVKP